MFVIHPETSTDGYYHSLRQGPEFLQDIDSLLSTDICNKFREQSNNYFALCRVPLNKVIFDGRDDINAVVDRTKIYLTLCFDAIFDVFISHDDRIGKNYMIQLNDYESIPVEKYIEI